MNPKALKSLEYYKIIDQLTEKASSQMGKDLCRHLLPSEDVYEIRHMQTQTRDALTRLFQKGNISFGSVKDVRGSLKRLEIGSSLGISELLAIAGLLENTNRVKAYSRNERGDAREDSLDGMFESLEPLTPLSAEIRRCIPAFQHAGERRVVQMQAAEWLLPVGQPPGREDEHALGVHHRPQPPQSQPGREVLGAEILARGQVVDGKGLHGPDVVAGVAFGGPAQRHAV